jgi:hypothetical protein
VCSFVSSETTTVTVPQVVHATATATTTATVHKQTTITQHVRSTKTVATEYQTSTATVTAAAEYHKRFFNLLWNSFFQKLYLKDAALTEIKCAALGYKPSVVYVHVPKTETVYKTQTNFVATNTKTETKTIVEPTTTTLVEHVPVTATQKVTVTTTVPAAVPTKAPVPSYPTCSGSGSTGTSWALYTGVSYSLDSFYSFGCGDVQTCTNECNNSWSKHGKECAGIQWNPTSKLCSLKGEASTAAKFSFGFDFSSSLFLVKNKDCQSNSLWGESCRASGFDRLATRADYNWLPSLAPTQGNDCCCNYKA